MGAAISSGAPSFAAAGSRAIPLSGTFGIFTDCPDGRRLLDERIERKEPMAEELRIQAIDLAKVLRGMEANQPVTVTGLNDWGIIQVVSGLVCEIEPDPDPHRSDGYPFRVVIAPRGSASLTIVASTKRG